MAAIRDALPEGIEMRPGSKPYNPEREGLWWVVKVSNPKAAARLAAQHEGEDGLVAYEDGIGYAVYRTASEDAVDPEEARRAKERRERDEHVEAYETAYREMSDWATEPWRRYDEASRSRAAASRRPNLCAAVRSNRTRDRGKFMGVFSERARDVLGKAVAVAEDEDPSCLEVCSWLWSRHHDNGLMVYGSNNLSDYSARDFRTVYDTLLLDGWQPSEGAQALRALCPEEETEG